LASVISGLKYYRTIGICDFTLKILHNYWHLWFQA